MRSSGPVRKTSSKRRWVQTVRTVSTAPPPGTFTKPAREIAEIMARPDVSPTGLGSAIRMIQYFINRGGRRLTPNRRMQLERAKQMLQRRLARDRLAATAAEPSGSRRTRAVLTR